MSENITTKEVTIDLWINREEHYTGTCVVEFDSDLQLYKYTFSDSLSNLANCSDGCYYEGYRIGSIYNIMKWEALHQFGSAKVTQCEVSGYYVSDTNIVTLSDGRACCEGLASYFDEWDAYYLRRDWDEHYVRDSDGQRTWFSAPSSFFEDMCYCEHCECYIPSDYYNYEEDICDWCKDESIIEGYSASHQGRIYYFGAGRENFVGLGFELEVDCDDEQGEENNSVAKNLISSVGLEEHEVRYAHDGSLNYGFECISQPHTVKCFWEKQDKWAKMLKYLVRNGYRSHDTTTCGLHVHVSRGMFGKTQEEQNDAIAKVYTFFDENWDDIVKVSRRKNFGYCEKNCLDYESSEDVRDGKTTRFKEWKKKAKYARGHYVALNNANEHTFEYRLGRGTLNPWSFFSWIDFVVTITNNARRITVKKVNSNDLVSWFGGIKESTAKYIYKRGAFKDTMLALYPNIAWETNIDDTTEYHCDDD